MTIDTAIEKHEDTENNISPLFDQLSSALDTATARLDALNTPARRALPFVQRESDEEIAQTAAQISNVRHTFTYQSSSTAHPHFQNIAKTLSSLEKKHPGKYHHHIGLIDRGLYKVLRGLSLIVSGVLFLVANL